MAGFSLRLTHKIAAIGVVGVAGVILVGGIHMYGESAVAAYQDAAENARTIFELNSKIEIELLEGRRAEKDFLLRNDPKKAESEIEIAKAVAVDIDRLRQKVAAVGKPDLASKVDVMIASLKRTSSPSLNRSDASASTKIQVLRAVCASPCTTLKRGSINCMSRRFSSPC
jgi:methyl-accepting chemotaxis protein